MSEPTKRDTVQARIVTMLPLEENDAGTLLRENGSDLTAFHVLDALMELYDVLTAGEGTDSVPVRDCTADSKPSPALNPENVEKYIADLPWKCCTSEVMAIVIGNIRSFAAHLRDCEKFTRGE